ncbi:MAG: 2TM domain-containing protein [Ewingella sp.]
MNLNRIKQLRVSRAWSQEQLAELSSLSVRTVQRIENGEQASLETLGAIAAAFDIKVAELIAPAEMDENTTPDLALDQQIQAARRQVRDESNFYRRVIVFIIVNVILFVINRITTPGNHWFFWPLGIWGGLLIFRGLRVFVLRDWLIRWQQARLQKILRK